MIPSCTRGLSAGDFFAAYSFSGASYSRSRAILQDGSRTPKKEKKSKKKSKKKKKKHKRSLRNTS